MAGTNPFNARLIGLRMSVDADQLTVRVGPGSTYVPDSFRLSTDSDLTTTLVAPTASQWRHVYIYQGAGVAAIEAVTTAPDAAFQGTARLKTGDSTRRYLGSIFVGADGKLTPILHGSPGQYGNRIIFKNPGGVASSTVGLILNGILQTAATVDASNMVPMTSQILTVSIDNSATLPVYFSNSDLGTVSASNYLRTVKAGGGSPADLLLDSTQKFSYVFGAGLIGLGNVNVRAIGYFYDR